MNVEDAEEYTQALGQVVAGGWRQVALGERLGVPRTLGLSTRDWVEGRLGGYVRLAIPERREAVAELTSGEEPISNRQAAAVLGVGEATVRRDREDSAPNDAPELEAVQEPQVAAGEPEAPAPNDAPEPERPSQAVTDFLDSDQDLQRAHYRVAFMRAMNKSDSFLQFEPEKVAEVADPVLDETVDGYLTNVKHFVEKYHRARPSLRAVQGGKA